MEIMRKIELPYILSPCFLVSTPSARPFWLPPSLYLRVYLAPSTLEHLPPHIAHGARVDIHVCVVASTARPVVYMHASLSTK